MAHTLLIAHRSLPFSAAGNLARKGPQFADHCRADFARQSRLVEVRQEEASQPARRNLASEIGLVDLITNAITPFLAAGFELAAAGASSGQSGLLAGGA